MEISVAHSPDADDYFLFWGIRKGVLESPFTFSFLELDTQDLNSAARGGEFDVCAISVAAYPEIARDYLILSSGASVGRGFGPALVARSEIEIEDLSGKRIGIPGRTTTAAAVLRRLVPGAETIEIPLTPYSAVFDALSTGRVDAAVLIHEGQIAYQEHGLKLLSDLGRWWQSATGLPLPLGINVIKKSLGAEAIDKLARLFRQSIEYSLQHQDQILGELFEISQTKKQKLSSEAQLKRYLAMYANSDSVELRADCKDAIRLLCGSDIEAEFTI